jgi:DNA-binding response OmpR family regulator
MTVLLVEDEEAILEKYKLFLEAYCDTIYIAQDGEEAYQIYKENRPQIIIMDLYMPKVSGIELAKRIREEDLTIFFIALTGHSDRDTLLSIVDLHFSSYLTKPISRMDLLDALIKVSKQINENHLQHLPNGYSWDGKTKTLFCHDQQIELTKREQKLLELLINKAGVPCGDDEILFHVWDDNYSKQITNASIRTLVKNLRKKISKELIQNQYGVGYKINI